ncbi:MAG: polysulfide reductase NrfD [Planctomycetes bacterium]|nr:polysulfide reductase NrfD [Planctomycetota bacterium]
MTPHDGRSSANPQIEQALAPLTRTTWRFYAFAGVLLSILAVWAYFVVQQTLVGHGVQGLGTRGAIWGIIVANIVYLIGISHVGIAISASVRIMRLERYQPLARIAEIVTLVAMTAAVMNIALDVGRPDRFIVNVILRGQIHAPFVWSCTVITWYVVGSSVYLYLAMRRDICLAANYVPRRRWLYRLLAIGYQDTPESRERHERTVWWCAVIILPIMVSVHSVYGFVFGLQSGRPGWFNPIMAPYFVLGAILTGFSAMIIVAAVVRNIFPWKEMLKPRMFKGLGIFLGFITWLYMYFLFSELLTGQYNAPHADRAVWDDVLWGHWAPLTWATFIFSFFIPFAILFIQGANHRICSIPLTVVAAVFSNVGLWIMRYLIVVPSFYHPHLPYRITPYSPTFAEWAVLVGTLVFGILFFGVLIKILPVIELPHNVPIRTDRRFVFMPRITIRRNHKRLLLAATAAGGIGMMIFGFSTWQADYAPVKWLTGILMLCSIPLEICLLTPREETARPQRPGAPRVSVQRYLATSVQCRVPAPRLGVASVTRGSRPPVLAPRAHL